MIKSEKGQATVELALSISILLFLVFGIIGFGHIFHVYLTLEHASREGARGASVGRTDTEIVEIVKNSSQSLDSTKLSITTTPIKTERKKGVYATVTLSYPVDVSLPLLDAIFPTPFNVQTKTVMRVE